jgi:N-acetylneuraminic acid mutarotase
MNRYQNWNPHEIDKEKMKSRHHRSRPSQLLETLEGRQFFSAAHPAVTWKAVAPAPIALFESAGETVGGKVDVFGGFDTAQVQTTLQSEAYSPVKNRWTPLADMPEPLTHTGHVRVGKNIWFVGGLVGDAALTSSSNVWIYNTRSNSWRSGPSLPQARGAGALARVGSKLYFFGGLLTRAEDQGEQWVLDLRHPHRGWVAAAPLPVPCNHLAAVTLGGRIYAIGGQHLWNEDTDNVSAVQVYNPRTNTWKLAAPLPTGRGHIADSTFVFRGRIVVIGGAANGDPALADVLDYRPATNTWSLLTEIPAPRRAPVAVAVGNKLVVTTGDPGDVTPTAQTWVGVFHHW